MKKKTKRNPADLTKRNNDARKKEIAALKKKINDLIVGFNHLNKFQIRLHRRVTKLEQTMTGVLWFFKTASEIITMRNTKLEKRGKK